MTMEINHQHSNVMEMKTDAGVDTSDKMMTEQRRADLAAFQCDGAENGRGGLARRTDDEGSHQAFFGKPSWTPASGRTSSKAAFGAVTKGNMEMLASEITMQAKIDGKADVREPL